MSVRSFPPPEEAEARFDAVVRRGRSLRRRRRIEVGAGALGGMVVVAVAASLMFGRGEDRSQELVDDTERSTTTTSAPATPETFTVDVEVSDDADTVEVTLSNPAQRYVDAAAASQCVHLLLVGAGDQLVDGRPVVAETSDCNAEDGAAAPFEIQPDGVQISCAAFTPEQSTAPAEVKTRPAVDEFEFPMPDGLPPGEYVLEANGASGSGDGCAPAQPGELEDIASDRVTFRVD